MRKTIRLMCLVALASLLATGLVIPVLALGSSFTFRTIEVPGALTQVYGINDAGQVVGYYNDASGGHGFLLSGGSFSTINVPNSYGAQARGINNAGQIVGFYRDDNGEHGFLLSAAATSARLMSPVPAIRLPTGLTMSAKSWDITTMPVAGTAFC
jgi:probable HAF family extracellular repeat protein